MKGSKKVLYCFLNGKFIKESRAKISVNDIGLHRGYGVFEVLRTYFGKPFLLNEHLKRLLSSSKEINLKVPYSNNEISKFIYILLAKNKHKESLIKILLTGGETKDGITPKTKPTFLILAKNLKKQKKEIYKNGVKLITYEYERFIPSAKTLNYIHLVKSLNRLEKEKAFTLLYTSNGKVLEGATCNIFIVKDNKLITPDKDILNGITRNLVLRLASKHLSIHQRKLSLKELYSSDEAFLTLTTKGIVPVISVDNKKIGNGKPGEYSKQLIALFDKFINTSHK